MGAREHKFQISQELTIKTKAKSSFHFVNYLKLLQFVLLGFHKNLFASLELFHI